MATHGWKASKRRQMTVLAAQQVSRSQNYRARLLFPNKRHLKIAAMVATHLCWEAEANLEFQVKLDYVVRSYLEGRRKVGR